MYKYVRIRGVFPKFWEFSIKRCNWSIFVYALYYNLHLSQREITVFLRFFHKTTVFFIHWFIARIKSHITRRFRLWKGNNKYVTCEKCSQHGSFETFSFWRVVFHSIFYIFAISTFQTYIYIDWFFYPHCEKTLKLVYVNVDQ